MVDKEESVFLYKTSCDSCRSSDANALYSDGHTHCFSCSAYTSNTGKKMEQNKTNNLNFNPVDIEYKSLTSRRISETTARRFKYGINNGRHVMNYFDESGQLTAQKFRTKDKTFSWIGNAKGSTLFGQQLVSPNKKLRIVITEGEIDAMSLAEIQQNKYPVVSVPNGAAAAVKDVKKNLEYLMGFEEVIICFDNDEVGIEAANKVAQLFPPNTAKIARMPLKDISDMLMAGRVAEVIKALWDAQTYKLAGILNGTELINKVMEEAEEDNSYPYPAWLPILNEKCFGMRLGELEIWTSGSGMGKSSLLKQLQLHYFKTTNLNQGLINLEESIKFTGRSLIALELETRVHTLKLLGNEIIAEKAEMILNSKDDNNYHRFSLYDQFGSIEEEDLYSKIRYLAKGLNCKVIWIDHISIIVSGMQDNDERKTIDRIMTKLKTLTQELKVYIGLISHLNNNNTTEHTFETGKIGTLNNLRGSSALKQLSDSVFILSRNQQAESEEERSTTLVTVLKHRYSGYTGPSDYIFYNTETGCFEKTEKPSGFSKQREDNNKDF